MLLDLAQPHVANEYNGQGRHLAMYLVPYDVFVHDPTSTSYRSQDKADVSACYAVVGCLPSACGKAASNMWILPVQIDMLLPGLLGDRDDFGERYCGHVREEVARGVYAWTGSSNLEELNAVLCQHLMIRRFKKDVLQDLPPKLRQQICIPVATKHSRVSLQRQM